MPAPSSSRGPFVIRHTRTLLCILFVFIYSVSLSYAVPPTTKYAPGTTLDPTCTPGSTNCSVQILASQTGNANTFLTSDGTLTAWSSKTLVLGGNFETAGNFQTTLTATGTTALTLPTSGTLATTANINTAVSGTLNYVPKYTSTNTIGNSVIYDDGTNIGVGTASPSSKLQVSGDIRITSGSGGQIIFADGSTMASSGLGSAAALSNITDAIVTGDSDANATGAVILKTASTTRLHILNTGNVGINTATPSALFSVGATSPFQVTNLGAVIALSYAGAGTGLTGTAASLTAGNVTTNANLTGVITSVGNATAIASQTGTGTTFVMSVSPTLTTPNIGAATGTSIANSGSYTQSGASANTFTGTSTFSNVTPGSFSLRVSGDMSIASGKTLAFRDNQGIGTYSIHYADGVSGYPLRFVGNSDSVSNRYFEFGYYTGDSQANTWNAGVRINSYNGNVTTTGTLTTSIGALGTAGTTFLTHTAGLIQSRTAAQVLADIGGASAALYVPYTGATTDVTLGAYNMTATTFLSNNNAATSVNPTAGAIFTNSTIGANPISPSINLLNTFTGGIVKGTRIYSNGFSTGATFNIATTNDGTTFTDRLLLSSAGLINVTNAGGFIVQLNYSGVTATRILTLPDVTGILATINGGQTFTSAIWNAGAVTSSGAVTGTSFVTTGGYTQSGSTANTFTGASTFSTDSPIIINRTNSNEAKIGLQDNGVIRSYIGATAANMFTLANAGSGVVQTSVAQNGNITTVGTVSSSGYTTTGGYTQSGTTANTFTGTSTFSNATYSALFTGGNVGIGTASPNRKLSVKGFIGFEATNSTNDWILYTHTDNTFRFNYNGAGNDEMVIDSSGNVGIGTASPAQLLHTVGGTMVSASIGSYTLNGVTNGNAVFSGDSGSAFGFGKAAIIGAGGPTGGVIKTNPLGFSFGSAGIVGFGHDTAGGGRTTFGVYGYTQFDAVASAANSNNSPVGGIFISELTGATGSSAAFGGTAYGVFAKADTSAATASAGTVIGVLGSGVGKTGDTVYGGQFYASGGTTNYGIYSSSGINYFSGNVGIGTISPTAINSAGSASATVLGIGNSGTSSATRGEIQLSNAATAADILTGAILFGTTGASGVKVGASIEAYNDASSVTTATQRLVFATTGVERMRIASGGKIGIGTDNPTGYGAQVNVIASASAGMFLTSNGSSNVIAVWANSGGGDNPFIGFLTDGGTQRGAITYNRAGTSIVYGTGSDRRLKENIVPTNKGLDTLMQIQVQDFNFISDQNHNVVQGFIAQDLYTVYPFAVTSGGDDPQKNPWQVDYGRLTPLIIQSIQEMSINVTNISDMERENTWRDSLIAWLADATNGIEDFVANRVRTKELCVAKADGTEFCANGDQLEAMVGNTSSSSPAQPPQPEPTPDPAPEPAPEPTPQPVVEPQPTTEPAPTPEPTP